MQCKTPVIKSPLHIGSNRSSTHIVRANSSPRRDLLSALFTHARREVVNDWAKDLVLPLVSEDHGSEFGEPTTVPPTNLAEDDSKWVDVEGIHIHYKERLPPKTSNTVANATAPPVTVLLLHGFNGSTFNWRFALEPVSQATGARVIAFDRPPFGLTQRPTTWGPDEPLKFNPYEPEGAARITQGFLDALRINDDVVVVGHSAGALLAMELHKRQPHRISGIVLVAPAVPAREGGLFGRMTFGSQLRLLAMRAVLQSDTTGVRYMRRQLLKQRDKVVRGEPGGVPHATGSVDREVAEGYIKPLNAVDWDYGALLNIRSLSMPNYYDMRSVTVPVMVIQGKEDNLVSNAKDLVTLFEERPEGSTEFVELDCGHVPPEELPEEFNAELIKFVTSQIQKH